MSVTINGKTFLTASEVSAMTPSGTIDSQWETYTLPIPTGTIAGWDGNRFLVNKVTGLVTGWVTIQQMYNLTNHTIGTNANLAPHNDMRLKYTGQYEYGTVRDVSTTDKCPDSIKLGWKECNGIWNTSGTLTLQGQPTSTSYIKYYNTFIEHYTHIGSKYGEITTTDIEPVVYLPQGAFYTANTAKLLCGKAWLRTDISAPSGYTSSSYVTLYKNLWSGEVIMQYSLYPNTAGTCPAITLPTRYAVVDGRNFYTDVRYTTGRTTAAQRQSTWMRLANTTLSFNAPSADWLTGTLYYPSTPEVRTHNVSYEVSNGNYLTTGAGPIPSASSGKFPSATSGQSGIAVIDSYWLSANGYKSRSGVNSWLWRSLRTGMVFGSFDMTFNGNGSTSPIMSAFDTNWIPSYRYNTTAGTSQPVYFAGAGYLGSRKVAEVGLSEYTCNLRLDSGKSLGVVGDINQLYWGSTGNSDTANGSLCCFTGQFLGNTTANIVR